MNKDYVYDCESDGLLEDLTTIHCIVMQDLKTGEVFEFGPDNIDGALALMSQARSLIAHNQISFDLRALKTVRGWTPNPATRIIDTLILSKLSNRDREMPFGCPATLVNEENGLKKRIGPHGLDSWGWRCGYKKPEYSQWEEYDQEMLERCKADVEINARMYGVVLQEMGHTHSDLLQPWSAYRPAQHNPRERNYFYGMMLEQFFAETINKQVEHGIALDLPKLNGHIDELTRRESLIEPGMIVSLGNLYIKKDSRWGKDSKKNLTDFEMMGLHVTADDYKFVKNVFKGNGELTALNTKWAESEGVDPDTIAGPFSRTVVTAVGMTQTRLIARVMKNRGWEPTELTARTKKGGGGSPKLNVNGEPCPNLAKIPGGLGKEYAELLKIKSRRSQLQGFIRNMRPDQTIPSDCDPLGTPTGRVTHKVVTNLPKASAEVYFGYEMRDVFVARSGKANLGWDISSMESRIGWHFAQKMMGGAEYVKEMMNVDDSHIHLKDYIKDNLSVEVSRNHAKTTNYCSLFGAGPEKIAKTLDEPLAVGQALYDGYWALHAPMREFADKCTALAKAKGCVDTVYYKKDSKDGKHLAGDVKVEGKPGFIGGIDGRGLVVRKSFAAMNTMIQSAGQQLAKLALKLKHDRLAELGVDWNQLGFFHDEVQCEINKSEVKAFRFDSEEKALTFIKEGARILSQPREINGTWFVFYHIVGEVAVQSVRKAGEILGLRVPMDAQYQVGNSLAETH